jgi:aminoglycoside 6-adenylyltransferase
VRNEREIKNLITGFATKDDRIRVVLLNGSRANSNIQPDKLQDFDIVFIVTGYESFVSDLNWTNFFGEKLIYQLPDEMTFGKENAKGATIGFHYLMLFKDGNRIDLTLFPIEFLKTHFVFDSLTIVWLDKDNLFPNAPPPSDINYHIRRPTEKEFLDTCNEFWWVSTYVAKGLIRKEITYAKEMLDSIVRPMFMKIIQWKIGVENNFAVSFGKGGKFMFKYLNEDYSTKVLQTYADFDIENNWKSLFVMTDLFEQASCEIAFGLKFQQDKVEIQNTISYLKLLHYRQKNYR